MGGIIETTNGNYVISDPEADNLANQRDMLDLISLCPDPTSHKLLITEGALHPDFFDLSTGLAGELALKLTSYLVKTAIVVDLDSVPSQRFREWAGECNRGREIHFCASQKDAEGWLLG